MALIEAFWDSYLVDSNILLRIPRWNEPENAFVDDAIAALRKSGAVLYFTHQNIAEFWNVATRPLNVNGFGLTHDETEREVRSIERAMVFLPDGPRVYAVWRNLVATRSVSGKQVHDARLVAAMMVHGVTRLLTLNTADFKRYPEITAVHPRAVGVL
jgi:predicted nucleic acid-binding protein